MTATLIIGFIIAMACLYWIEAEQADYERANYDPRKERKE